MASTLDHDPKRPFFTDTHVHFYDLAHDVLVYDWLDPDAPPDPELGDYSTIKSQRYWADDFIAETRFQRVGNVIHVQAASGTDDPVAETRWLQAFADRTGVPHGIVGYCDLSRADAETVISGHVESALVCGIRDLRFDDNDYLRREEWRRGYGLLERYGLVACDSPPFERLTDARALAEAFPGVTLCIDHAGTPTQRDRDHFREWRSRMATIASAPNTVVKISGLGMHDHAWTVDSIRDWVLTCIDLWGVDRSFFGTNWPIERLFSSYGDLLCAYWDIIVDFQPHERTALFNETADRVFGISRAANEEH